MKLVALLSVLVAMVTPGAAKPDIDARIAALERKVKALAVGEKGGGNAKQMKTKNEICKDKCDQMVQGDVVLCKEKCDYYHGCAEGGTRCSDKKKVCRIAECKGTPEECEHTGDLRMWPRMCCTPPLQIVGGECA